MDLVKKRVPGKTFSKLFIQIRRGRCLSVEAVNQTDEPSHWCEAIYDAKAAELILYGRALGLNHGEAEDVLQETFLGLMPMPFAPGKPAHYVVRSFRNRALNYRRSLWRRLAREVLADCHLLGDQLWFDKSPDESPGEIAAMRCLAELPVEQREVIVLKVWHGCTFEEIGGLLEIPPNTAAGRYRYGLQKMKLKLAADAPTRGGEPEEGVTYERTGRESIAWLASASAVGEA